MNDVALPVDGPEPLRERLLSLLGDALEDPRPLETFLGAGVDLTARLWFGEEGLARIETIDQLRRMIDRDICEIDAVLNRACNAILHHHAFTRLEASWRGIWWLSGALGTDGLTRLRILDCRWAELARDLERAEDFDQSALFELVYNQEFGMPGGIPFGLLIGLYEMQHRPSRGHPTDDVSVLRRLSAVATASFAPFVLGAGAPMFGVDSLGDLDRRTSLSATFRAPEYSRFNAFRTLAEARFIGLACPRVLLRAPYRARDLGDLGFPFTETVVNAETDQVWGVGALAIAHICIRAFNDYRWLAAVRGTVPDTLAGGVVADLALVDFETDAPDTILKIPLEVNLTERTERDLTEGGFICIRQAKYTPYCVINNIPSTNKATTRYTSDIAQANDQLSSMLNYMLCVSRFAHYVKVMARDWIGSYISPEECQRRLSMWLNEYCSVGEDMSYELRARFPLQSGRVRVQAIPGKPGSYECSLWLKPHLQLDQAISEFHLVTMVQGVDRRL
jgi:type VI secretion system protein ImpD